MFTFKYTTVEVPHGRDHQRGRTDQGVPRRHHRLDGLNLSIPRRVIYGLLGPNGAGKTTLIRILATLLRPGAGTARVAGYDVARHPAAVRERIGLAGQFTAVDDHLTGRATIAMVVFPMTLTSSVFLPTQTMPGWPQGFAEHQPITIVANAPRELTLGRGAPSAGHTVIGETLPALTWTAGILAISAPLAIHTYGVPEPKAGAAAVRAVLRGVVSARRGWWASL